MSYGHPVDFIGEPSSAGIGEPNYPRKDDSDDAPNQRQLELHSPYFDTRNGRFVSLSLYVCGVLALFVILFVMSVRYGMSTYFSLLFAGIPSSLLACGVLAAWFQEYRQYCGLLADGDTDMSVINRLSKSIRVIDDDALTDGNAKPLGIVKGERKFVVFFGQAEDTRRVLVGARAAILLEAEKLGANTIFNYKITVSNNNVVFSGLAAVNK